MKKILNITMLLGVTVFVFISCEDKDTYRLPAIEKTVNMRLQLDPDFTFFDATDVPNAKLRFSMFTEDPDLDSVNLYVDYYNFASDSIYDQVKAAFWTSADFTNGMISNYDLTSVQIATALGINVTEMSGGDRLDFTSFIRLKDGTVYPDTIPGLNGAVNTTPNILNSPTTSLTTSFTAFIACPVPAGYGEGTYTLEQISGPGDPFFGGNTIKTTTDVVISPSVIGRQTSVNYVTFGGGTFNFLLVCGNILIPYSPAPASCGGGLGWIGDSNNPSTYDEADDSEFIINLIDNPFSDCGLAPNPMTVKLTKQ